MSSLSEPADGLAPSPPHPPRARYSDAYLRWVLFMLFLVYVFNFIDRTILTVLSQAIKEEFRLSDLQLGVLGGIFFALLYTTCGIPIARLAERRNRVTIISLAVAIWSIMTALCGTAAGFWQLALYRIGVGIGEAGCTPPAQSLISDYFPPERRASALSIYSLGIPIGGLIGTVAGGWIAQDLGWRTAFIAVGLPGVVLAIIAKLTIQDPPRGHSEASASADAAVPTLQAVFSRLVSKPTFIHICIAATIVSFVGYGNNQFAVTYFIREFHLDLKTASFALGMVGGVSAAIGTMAGGFVTDWLGGRDKRWYAWTPAIGVAVATPLLVAAYSQSNWMVAIAILTLPGIFHYTYLGPTFSLTHNMVEPRMRASATALLFFVLNLIGLGLGPPFVGALSDFLAAASFTAGDFATLCPGGRALAGAPGEMVSACLGASAAGNRQAIIINSLLLLWGALHYFLAARTVRQNLTV